MDAGGPNGQRLQSEPAVAGCAAARAGPCLQAGIVGAADEVLVWDLVQIHGRLQQLLKLGQVLRIMVFAQRCCKSARIVSFSCTTGLPWRSLSCAHCHCFECAGQHCCLPGGQPRCPKLCLVGMQEATRTWPPAFWQIVGAPLQQPRAHDSAGGTLSPAA